MNPCNLKTHSFFFFFFSLEEKKTVSEKKAKKLKDSKAWNRAQDSDWERRKMESPISICNAEISLQTQNIDAFTASFAESLRSLLPIAQETARSQGPSLPFYYLSRFRLTH